MRPATPKSRPNTDPKAFGASVVEKLAAFAKLRNVGFFVKVQAPLDLMRIWEV